MSSPRELLTFPGLRAARPARASPRSSPRCQLKADHDDLEDIGARGLAAPHAAATRLWERLWRPLLDSKFDGRLRRPARHLPVGAQRRMAGTRDRSSREVMGAIDGGYQVLVDRLARRDPRPRRRGPAPRRRCASCPPRGGRAFGVVLDTGMRRHDQVVTTQLRPGLAGLLAPDLRAALGPDPTATSASSASSRARGAASARTTR